MKYVHTNIIARDWKSLADFYIDVFGCKKVLPERNLKGDWIEKGTGIKDVRIEGAHLRLPGYEEDGPTLEIFQYNTSLQQNQKRINLQGFAHIAFRVESVEETLQAVLRAGGTQLSGIIRKKMPDMRDIVFVYAQDPEGNFIELQKYENSPS